MTSAAAKARRTTATAALGFKLHTGWAIAVGVLSTADNIEVLLRRRIELLPREDNAYRFVYHRASELPLAQAEASIRRIKAEARKASTLAVRDLLRSMNSLGFAVKRAGVMAGTRTVPKDLSAILNSHPLIHTAEGIFFQQVVADACKRCHLEVISFHERDSFIIAGAQRGLEEFELQRKIDSLRKSLGTPWGADHKVATAMALAAAGAGRQTGYAPLD